MNYTQKHDKLARTIYYTTPENFLDSLSSIEYSLLLPPAETAKSLVPNEPNFQLPNVFLKTRSNFLVEKLFRRNRPEDDFSEEIGRLLKILDEIEVEQATPQEGNPFDEKVLEILIKYRHQ